MKDDERLHAGGAKKRRTKEGEEAFNNFECFRLSVLAPLRETLESFLTECQTKS